MRIVVCTNNRKDAINISQRWILNNDQVVILRVLAHTAGSFSLWFLPLLCPAYTSLFITRSGKAHHFPHAGVLESWTVGMRWDVKVRPNEWRISRAAPIDREGIRADLPRLKHLLEAGTSSPDT